MKSLINIFLLTATLAGQYPADSLFQDSNNNIFQKMFLYPIAKWQRISYNSEKISCQFHPKIARSMALEQFIQRAQWQVQLLPMIVSFAVMSLRYSITMRWVDPFTLMED